MVNFISVDSWIELICKGLITFILAVIIVLVCNARNNYLLELIHNILSRIKKNKGIILYY